MSEMSRKSLKSIFCVDIFELTITNLSKDCQPKPKTNVTMSAYIGKTTDNKFNYEITKKKFIKTEFKVRRIDVIINFVKKQRQSLCISVYVNLL